jgi:hypothetical protein
MRQLLDYGCWPGGPETSALVVVGEPELNLRTSAYLEHLSRRFPAPISYRCIKFVEDGV